MPHVQTIRPFAASALRCAVLLAAGAAAPLSGCAGKAQSEDAIRSDRPVLRPSPIRRNAEADELNRHATDLQDGLNLMNQREQDWATPPIDAPRPQSSRTRSNITPTDSPATVGANIALAAPELAKDRKEDKKTPAQIKAAAMSDLIEQLAPGIAAGKHPLKSVVPLIGIDMLQPGIAATHLDEIRRSIQPDQQQAVLLTEDLLRTIANDPMISSGDRNAFASLLRNKADELTGSVQSGSLALATVALCRRVDGYGRFSPLETSTFVVGKPISFILYTEVQNFTLTATQGTSDADKSGWAVELGQEVRLFLDSDGTEQMVVPEQTVKDISRSARRDFYVVQRVDLPKTLTVGQYNLKIRMRDLSPSAGGALAEHIIPIRLVADPSAARTSR